MATELPPPSGRAQPVSPRWELDAETIAVKIRWFGLFLGYLYVNTSAHDHQLILNAILALGAGYALLDSLASLRGRVFLGRSPLVVSLMEALFIGLLCYYQGGLENSFRFYYLLSLICAAIRHSVRVTYVTCAFHRDGKEVRMFIVRIGRRDSTGWRRRKALTCGSAIP